MPAMRGLRRRGSDRPIAPDHHEGASVADIGGARSQLSGGPGPGRHQHHLEPLPPPAAPLERPTASSYGPDRRPRSGLKITSVDMGMENIPPKIRRVLQKRRPGVPNPTPSTPRVPYHAPMRVTRFDFHSRRPVLGIVLLTLRA